jgi:hypothetical protein
MGNSFPILQLPPPTTHTILRFSIAFKPAESGWGGGLKYANNFDKIFGSSSSSQKTTASSKSSELEEGQESPNTQQRKENNTAATTINANTNKA